MLKTSALSQPGLGVGQENEVQVCDRYPDSTDKECKLRNRSRQVTIPTT